MDHLIRFRTAEGIDGSHVAESLEDAVAFVERLRNVDGASDVRLYRLTEVPIEFKPYYRVEVGTAAQGGSGAPAHAAATEPTPAITSRRPIPGSAGTPTGPAAGDPGQSFSGEAPATAPDGRRLFSRG